MPMFLQLLINPLSPDGVIGVSEAFFSSLTGKDWIFLAKRQQESTPRRLCVLFFPPGLTLQLWGSIDYLERDDVLYTFHMCETRVKISSEKAKRTFGHFTVGTLRMLLFFSQFDPAANENRDVRVLKARKSLLNGVILVREPNGDVVLQSLCNEPIHFTSEPEREIRPVQEA